MSDDPDRADEGGANVPAVEIVRCERIGKHFRIGVSYLEPAPSLGPWKSAARPHLVADEAPVAGDQEGPGPDRGTTTEPLEGPGGPGAPSPSLEEPGPEDAEGRN